MQAASSPPSLDCDYRPRGPLLICARCGDRRRRPVRRNCPASAETGRDETLAPQDLPCAHRSSRPLRQMACGLCGGRERKLDVFRCELLGEECTLSRAAAGSRGPACCLGCEHRIPSPQPPVPVSRITACITTFLRPRSLERLVRSIERRWPGLEILIQQTGGNLSWGRNGLVRAASTPYVLILEDDFEFTAATRLELLADALDGDDEIGLVGGHVVEGGHLRSWSHDFDPFRGTAWLRRSRRPWRSAGRAVYRPCDAVLNFALARREALLETPWDEELPLSEHVEFFWRLKQAGRWRVAYCPHAGVVHHRDRPPDYVRWRARTFTDRVRDKIGARFRLAAEEKPTAARPNIVVLGVGHANTSITTRQLAALGWQLGDADAEYAESVSVRTVNQRLLSSGQFDRQAAAEALAALPQPWAVKDPRFAETLDAWLPLLAAYEPLLLWVTKDHDRVVRSYQTNDGLSPAEAEERVAQRELDCAEHFFRRWPWRRLQLDAAEISAAVGLFDLDR